MLFPISCAVNGCLTSSTNAQIDCFQINTSLGDGTKVPLPRAVILYGHIIKQTADQNYKFLNSILYQQFIQSSSRIARRLSEKKYTFMMITVGIDR